MSLIPLILLTSCGYLSELQLPKPPQKVGNLIPIPVEKTDLIVTVSAKGIVAQDKIVAKVLENQIAQIHLGQDVMIVTAERGKKIRPQISFPVKQPSNSRPKIPQIQQPLLGQVKYIATEPTVEENHKTFAVEIALTDAVANQLNDQENVLVDFAVSELSNILVVPTIAIRKQNDTTGVLVGKPNQPPKFVAVTIGTSNRDRTEVTSGLNGTEHILIEASQLPPGQKPPLQPSSPRTPQFPPK